MFNGMPTRVVTAMVVCVQLASMFLAIAIPAPQSLAREGKVQLEANDLAFQDSLVLADGRLDETGGEERLAVSTVDAGESALADEASTVDAEEGAFGNEAWPLAEASVVSDVAEVGYAAEGAISSDTYAADELRTQGVIYDGAYCYTWYSQRVLPGGGLSIDGRHVSQEGYVVDADERIVVASSDLPQGTEVSVPFGSGKAVVCDTGCAPGTIDVYTDF